MCHFDIVNFVPLYFMYVIFVVELGLSIYESKEK